MTDIVIFGGTTEGRELCEFCSARGIKVLYCAATDDGARAVSSIVGINTSVGRLDSGAMSELLGDKKPAVVIDATHPFAKEASANIARACEDAGTRLVRVLREQQRQDKSLTYFNGMDELLAWLGEQPGDIFVTLGSSCARAFSIYRDRLWLRILPNLNSLTACLEAGLRPERLICMQGPFSAELNRAMFAASKARILITKDSGASGGFPEKIQAAKELGMKTAVLRRPDETKGVSLEEATEILSGMIK